MYEIIKYIIETIIAATIPVISLFVKDYFKNEIISSIIAAIIASLFMFIVITPMLHIKLKYQNKNGIWYEYISTTPDKPFSYCTIKTNFFSRDTVFKGTNYSRDSLNDTTTLHNPVAAFSSVDFSSVDFLPIKDGFIYNIKGKQLEANCKNSERDKYGIGKYEFCYNKIDGITFATGFYIDNNDAEPKIKEVIMFKKNRHLFKALGIKSSANLSTIFNNIEKYYNQRFKKERDKLYEG